MTIAEMRQRRSEIETRKEAIEARKAEVSEMDLESMQGAEVEAVRAELEGYATEAEALDTEYSNLEKEETRAMLTATEFQPVLESTALAAPAIRDKFATQEYREAFRAYWMHGVVAPILKRDTEGTTLTTDVPEVIIPTTITNRLYKTDPHFGAIYNRVTKTSYAPGAVIPVMTFKPTVSWPGESNVAPTVKATPTGNIIFAGYKAQVAVGRSYETDVMALDEFENGIVAKIQEAFMQAFDAAIVSGDGDGKPTGILKASGKTFTMTDVSDYQQWLKSYAQVPMAEKANAKLHINQSDWYNYILPMKDANGLPYAQFTYGGFGGDPTPMFMGKEVVLLENQGLDTYDDGSGIFAFWFDDSDYVLNINDSLKMREYIDENTDDIIRKATVMCDGKVIDADSLVFISK